VPDSRGAPVGIRPKTLRGAGVFRVLGLAGVWGGVCGWPGADLGCGPALFRRGMGVVEGAAGTFKRKGCWAAAGGRMTDRAGFGVGVYRAVRGYVPAGVRRPAWTAKRSPAGRRWGSGLNGPVDGSWGARRCCRRGDRVARQGKNVRPRFLLPGRKGDGKANRTCWRR